jgi:hypothetical protein
VIFLLLSVLSTFLLVRCAPNQSESRSIEAPTFSPTPSPTSKPIVDEPTPSASPEETLPVASNTPSPTAKPSVKPPAVSTKTASPTPRKSVKPTSSPSEEVIEPDTTVINDADGDGWPDYIKPTITFTNITCEELEDKFVYKYDINFLGGDNYARRAEVRGGFQMRLEDGKFWFSITEAELRHPRYVGPIIYKINSVEDRSWTYYEWMNLSKANNSWAVERGARGIQSPLYISNLYTGIRESFPKPDIDYSLCRK